MESGAEGRPGASAPSELRFARSAQAVHWAVAGVAALCVSAALGLLAWPAFLPPAVEPLVRPWGWALVPLPVAAGCLGFAMRLAGRPYLILSPVGVELFPVFRVADHARVVLWEEVEDLEVDPGCRRLSVRLRGGGGVVATLGPLRARHRRLLAAAVRGERERRLAGPGGPGGSSPGGVAPPPE